MLGNRNNNLELDQFKHTIKNNLINYLFSLIKDDGINEPLKNGDILHLLHLLLTDKKEICDYGLNDFIYLREKKFAILALECFYAMEESFVLNAVFNALSGIRNKLSSDTEGNNFMQLVKDEINKWNKETDFLFKNDLIKRINNENRGILLFDGNQYELIYQNEKIGMSQIGENCTITLTNGDEERFFEQHDTPENYNGSYSFNNEKSVEEILKLSIINKDNRKILAIDIMARLKQFSKMKNELNIHDQSSAERLIDKEWQNLYDEQIRYEKKRDSVLAEKNHVVDINKNKVIPCEFSMEEENASLDEDSIDLIEFHRGYDESQHHQKPLQDITEIENALTAIHHKMLDYCSSFDVAEKFIAEYTLNPYFNLGIQAATLCANAQGKSLFFVKSADKNKWQVTSCDSMNHANDDESIYLRYREDDVLFCEFKRKIPLKDPIEMINLYFDKKRNHFIKIFNQLMYEIQDSMSDMKNDMELIDNKIKTIEENHSIVAKKYNELRKNYHHDDKILLSLTDFKQQTEIHFKQLTVETKNKLNAIISFKNKLHDEDLYKNLINFIVLPDAVRDKNDDTLFHVVIRSGNHRMRNMIQILQDKKASVFIENKRWFGPNIFIVNELPDDLDQPNYKDAYFIKRKNKKTLYHVDKMQNIKKLFLNQYEFTQLYQTLKDKYSSLEFPILLNEIVHKDQVKQFWDIILSKNPKQEFCFPIKNVYEYYETPLLLAANLYGFEDSHSIYFLLLNKAYEELQSKTNNFSDSYKLLHDLSNEIIPAFKKVFKRYQLEQKDRVDGISDKILRFLKGLVGADFTRERAIELAMAYDIVFSGENRYEFDYSDMLVKMGYLLNNRKENIFNKSMLFNDLKITKDKIDKHLVENNKQFCEERDLYINRHQYEEMQKMLNVQQAENQKMNERLQLCEIKLQEYTKIVNQLLAVIEKKQGQDQKHDENNTFVSSCSVFFNQMRGL